MKRLLAALASLVLGLTLLSPAAPAAADETGSLLIPVTLATSPTAPVRFVVTFYSRDGVPLQSNQSSDQPMGTTSYEAVATAPTADAYYVAVSAHSYNGGIQQNWARMFVGGTRFLALADPVSVQPNVFTTTSPVTLPEATKITGTTTTDPATGVGTSSASLELWQLNPADSEWYLVDRFAPDSGGEFQWFFVEPGTYVVRSESIDGRLAPVTTPPFTTALGTTSTVAITIDQQRTYTSSRLAGEDRFETAAAITAQLFPGAGPIGIPVLYVANGMNFPDALGAGPAASIGGGALLPVLPNAIPEVIAEEIERLDPQRIVIVGGTAAVSSAVATQLGEWSGDVDRIAGGDRYQTSRAIVDDAFGCSDAGCSADTVFIATGLNYPDALSAGAAAGAQGAPVLLVNGGAAALDPATADLLDDLDPDTIFVLGGEAGVSAGIAADLEGHALWVERLAGADRFVTSALVARLVVERSDIVYGATGLGFADALVGGPLAAATGSPILLTQRDCAPVLVGDAVIGVDAGRIIYLGGAAVIGDVLRPDNAMSC